MWRGSGSIRVSPQIPLWNLAIGDNTGVTKSRFIVIFSLTADAAKPGSSLLADHRSRKMWNREQRAAISPTVPLLLPGAQKFIWFENLNTFSFCGSLNWIVCDVGIPLNFSPRQQAPAAAGGTLVGESEKHHNWGLLRTGHPRTGALLGLRTGGGIAAPFWIARGYFHSLRI